MTEPIPDTELKNETPLQRLRSEAILLMKNFAVLGYDQSLGVSSAAKWSVPIVTSLSFDKQTRENLQKLAENRLRKKKIANPSHQQILQYALEEDLDKRYGNTQAELNNQFGPEVLKQHHDRAQLAFQLEDFQQGPDYTNLDQLSEDYSRVVAKYGADIVENYWLPTRTVPPSSNIFSQLKPYQEKLSQRLPYYQLIRYYLGERDFSERQIQEKPPLKFVPRRDNRPQLEAVRKQLNPEPTRPSEAQEQKQYESLDDFYADYEKQRLTLGEDPEERDRLYIWVSEQLVNLSLEDEKALLQLGLEINPDVKSTAGINMLMAKRFALNHADRIAQHLAAREQTVMKEAFRTPQSPEEARLWKEGSDFTKQLFDKAREEIPKGLPEEEFLRTIRSWIEKNVHKGLSSELEKHFTSGSNRKETIEDHFTIAVMNRLFQEGYPAEDEPEKIPWWKIWKRKNKEK